MSHFATQKSTTDQATTPKQKKQTKHQNKKSNAQTHFNHQITPSKSMQTIPKERPQKARKHGRTDLSVAAPQVLSMPAVPGKEAPMLPPPPPPRRRIDRPRVRPATKPADCCCCLLSNGRGKRGNLSESHWLRRVCGFGGVKSEAESDDRRLLTDDDRISATGGAAVALAACKQTACRITPFSSLAFRHCRHSNTYESIFARL